MPTAAPGAVGPHHRRRLPRPAPAAVPRLRGGGRPVLRRGARPARGDRRRRRLRLVLRRLRPAAVRSPAAGPRGPRAHVRAAAGRRQREAGGGRLPPRRAGSGTRGRSSPAPCPRSSTCPPTRTTTIRRAISARLYARWLERAHDRAPAARGREPRARAGGRAVREVQRGLQRRGGRGRPHGPRRDAVPRVRDRHRPFLDRPRRLRGRHPLRRRAGPAGAGPRRAVRGVGHRGSAGGLARRRGTLRDHVHRPFSRRPPAVPRHDRRHPRSVALPPARAAPGHARTRTAWSSPRPSPAATPCCTGRCRASCWREWRRSRTRGRPTGAVLLGPRPGTWRSSRVGAGAPPLRTRLGWLLAFHGATAVAEGNVYSMGWCVLDGDDPSRVRYVSREPALAPEADYEIHPGPLPQVGMENFPRGIRVVFPCGLVERGRDLHRLLRRRRPRGRRGARGEGSAARFAGGGHRPRRGRCRVARGRRSPRWRACAACAQPPPPAPSASPPIAIRLDHLRRLTLDVTVGGRPARAVALYAEAPGYEPTGSPARDGAEGLACVDDAARAALVHLRRVRAVARASRPRGRARPAGLRGVDGAGRRRVRELRGRARPTQSPGADERQGLFLLGGARAVGARGSGARPRPGGSGAAARCGPSSTARWRVSRATSRRGGWWAGRRRRRRKPCSGSWPYSAPSPRPSGPLSWPPPRSCSCRWPAAIHRTRPGAREWIPRPANGTPGARVPPTPSPRRARCWAGAISSTPRDRRRMDSGRGAFSRARSPPPSRRTARSAATRSSHTASRRSSRARSPSRTPPANAGTRCWPAWPRGWFLGANAAGTAIYDEATGRGLDGIDQPSGKGVNRNAGAESTIESLLALGAVAAEPEAAVYARHRPEGTAVALADAPAAPRVRRRRRITGRARAHRVRLRHRGDARGRRAGHPPLLAAGEPDGAGGGAAGDRALERDPSRRAGARAAAARRALVGGGAARRHRGPGYPRRVLERVVRAGGPARARGRCRAPRRPRVHRGPAARARAAGHARGAHLSRRRHPRPAVEDQPADAHVQRGHPRRRRA